MSAFSKIEDQLPKFIEALNKMSADHHKAKYPTLYENGQYPSYEFTVGRKYIRVVSSGVAAYCFLDHEGNIYKPDGWKRPARHIRGSIFDPNFSIGKALGPYGVAYLK